jgi:GntR family transcriptional regulator
MSNPMLSTIERNSSVPLYKQVEEIVRALIRDGSFKDGELIPSENEISSHTGISRMTVRRGLQSLVQEGLLEAITGRGYCATPNRIQLHSGVLRSFSSEVIGMGMVPTSRVLEKETAHAPQIAQYVFGKNANSPLLKVRRVRCADNIPLALETSFFDLQVCRGLDEKDLHNSIYETLRNDLGIQIERAHQTIEAVSANDEEASLLEINSGAATLLLKRKSFDPEGRTVEYVESLIRGDRYAFTMELQ